jgi:integrase
MPSSSKSSSVTYLSRNPFSYCFRIKIPNDLQGKIGKKELRYSLKTGYLGKAKSDARQLAGICQMLFDQLREAEFVKKLNTKDIQYIVNQTIRSYLRQFESRRIIGAQKYVPTSDTSELQEMAERSGIKMPAVLDFTLSELPENALAMTTKALKASDNSLYKDTIHLLLKMWNLNYDRNAPEYLLISREFIKAMNTWSRVELNRNGGNYTDDVENLFPVPPVSELSLITEQVKKTSKASDDDPLISQVVQKYVQENSVKWDNRTKETYMASMNILIEILGDVQINSVRAKEIDRFRDTLKKLPPNRTKSPAYRNKPITELINMRIEKTLSNQTVNLHLQRIGTMIEYAIRHELYRGQNPAFKVQLPDDRDAKERRAPFNSDELTKIFRSKEYLEDAFVHSFQFWTPIIALFHGMRQNEIAQLHFEDIYKTEDGIWVFRYDKKYLITEQGLTSTKNIKGTSRRLIPINPFLLKELNFIEWCERLKKKDEVRLFPEIKGNKNGFGDRVSDWFNGKYKKSCGIESPDSRMRDFHSFRATLITYMGYKQLPKELRLRYVGHSIGK